MGRPPTVADDEILAAIALHPEPVVTARDLDERLGLEPESVLARLNQLHADGLLAKKEPGASAAVFWLSEDGRSRLPHV
jgi:predicted ArsR family transcriptional regulator